MGINTFSSVKCCQITLGVFENTYRMYTILVCLVDEANNISYDGAQYVNRTGERCSNELVM